MALFSKQVGLLGTENAFKIGPKIRAIEDQGKKVIKCNLGEPDFPVPGFIKDEVKRQIDLDNTHYCDPQGILPLRTGGGPLFRRDPGDRGRPGEGGGFPRREAPHRPVPDRLLRAGRRGDLSQPRLPIYESFIALRRGKAGAHPPEGGYRVHADGRGNRRGDHRRARG